MLAKGGGGETHKKEIVQENEGDRNAIESFGVDPQAQSSHGKTETLACGAKDQQSSTTDPFNHKGRHARPKHPLHGIHRRQDQGQLVAEAERPLQHNGQVISDDIDPSELLHEVGPGAQENPSEGLLWAVVEDLALACALDFRLMGYDALDFLQFLQDLLLVGCLLQEASYHLLDLRSRAAPETKPARQFHH